ncbi:MAG TPA: phosphoenolpyruvate synthase, partial [Gammaproteobacteria bacterium]|nr:phosphoenolpyruvate synthase [Gammaproteobacteria bacterium]
MAVSSYVIPFNQLGIHDIAQVGGKNASLGEMIRHLTNMGVKVPGGFATTSDAFQEFLRQENLNQRIQTLLKKLNIEDLLGLQEIGFQIRSWIKDSPLQPELIEAIAEAYKVLSPAAVAVRSSATAEDLPEASFAGQQETFLNVCGLENILHSVKAVFASLYTDRAIAYRVHKGFKHEDVALSVGIQKMVRSDLASSGVMFTLDTESGFNKVVFITSSYGLGELIVQGAVNPDEFYVYKPNLRNNNDPILRKTLGSKAQKMVFGTQQSIASIQTVNTDIVDQNKFSLTDEDIIHLAHLATKIEDHYGCAMDIEWAKDGNSQELYIVQARPETIHRHNARTLERYELLQQGKVVTTGRSIGQKIGQGKAKIINAITQIDEITSGDILVTDMTDPDWEPIMKKVAAIITNRGGRTCHAAIIARELGIPAIVGTHDATLTIQNQQEITVSCAQGDTGFVYEDKLPFKIHKIDLKQMPALP